MQWIQPRAPVDAMGGGCMTLAEASICRLNSAKNR